MPLQSDLLSSAIETFKFRPPTWTQQNVTLYLLSIDLSHSARTRCSGTVPTLLHVELIVCIVASWLAEPWVQSLKNQVPDNVRLNIALMPLLGLPSLVKTISWELLRHLFLDSFLPSTSRRFSQIASKTEVAENVCTLNQKIMEPVLVFFSDCILDNYCCMTLKQQWIEHQAAIFLLLDFTHRNVHTLPQSLVSFMREEHQPVPYHKKNGHAYCQSAFLKQLLWHGIVTLQFN